MNTEYLNEFLVLVKLKNQQAAADELFISNSTLSKHMSSLEDDVGVRLFERSGNKLSLTDEGVKFVRYASTITALERDFKVGIREGDFHSERMINLGVTPLKWAYNASAVISRVKKEAKDYKVRMFEDTRLELLEKLQNDEIDAALVVGEADPSRFKSLRLESDRFVCVVPSRIRTLAEDFNDLVQTRSVLFTQTSFDAEYHYTMRLVNTLLPNSRKVLHITRMRDRKAILYAVGQSKYEFSLLLEKPTLAEYEERFDLAFVPVVHPAAKVDINLVVRSDYTSDSALCSFFESVKKALPEEARE